MASLDRCLVDIDSDYKALDNSLDALGMPEVMGLARPDLVKRKAEDVHLAFENFKDLKPLWRSLVSGRSIFDLAVGSIDCFYNSYDGVKKKFEFNEWDGLIEGFTSSLNPHFKGSYSFDGEKFCLDKKYGFYDKALKGVFGASALAFTLGLGAEYDVGVAMLPVSGLGLISSVSTLSYVINPKKEDVHSLNALLDKAKFIDDVKREYDVGYDLLYR